MVFTRFEEPCTWLYNQFQNIFRPPPERHHTKCQLLSASCSSPSLYTCSSLGSLTVPLLGTAQKCPCIMGPFVSHHVSVQVLFMLTCGARLLPLFGCMVFYSLEKMFSFLSVHGYTRIWAVLSYLFS